MIFFVPRLYFNFDFPSPKPLRILGMTIWYFHRLNSLFQLSLAWSIFKFTDNTPYNHVFIRSLQSMIFLFSDFQLFSYGMG